MTPLFPHHSSIVSVAMSCFQFCDLCPWFVGKPSLSGPIVCWGECGHSVHITCLQGLLARVPYSKWVCPTSQCRAHPSRKYWPIHAIVPYDDVSSPHLHPPPGYVAEHLEGGVVLYTLIEFFVDGKLDANDPNNLITAINWD